jgi:anti-sigma factor RsiW
MTCDDVRQLAPEAALDLLDGSRRADVLGHLAHCSACRAELASLATTADALLAVASPAEPSAGFEQRVLARLESERTPAERRTRRRWFDPVAAAVVAAAVAAIVVGIVVGLGGRGDDRADGVVAARLLGTDGRAVGEVLLTDGPDRMVCVLDRAPAGIPYAVSVTGPDGVADAGRFTSEGPGLPWATDLPIDAADVRRVVIRDADGTVRATADLP